MKYLHAVGILAGVLTGGAVASTQQIEAQDKPQDKTGDKPSIVAQLPAQLPAPDGDPVIVGGGKAVDVRAFLAQVDEVATAKIIVAQNIASRITLDSKPRRLSDFLDYICGLSGLSWGYIDATTIVVLRARPNRTTIYVQQRPAPGQTPLRQSRPSGVPDGAQPFLFNGETVYRIPLQSKTAPLVGAEAKPEIKPGVATAR